MAQRTIVYWRDIPAQVIVRKGRSAAKRELPERFVQAIDYCAMKTGARDSDAYLAEWHRGDPQQCSDDLDSEADAAAAALEADFDQAALSALIDNDGWRSGEARTSKSLPRYLLIVDALAGDSTMTRFLDI